MKILYLAPPARHLGTKLGRYSFLHEEIEGLAEKGLDVYVLVPEIAPPTPNRVHTHPFESRPDPVAVRCMMRLLATQAGRLPPWNLTQPRKLLQALHVESFAARVIREEGIQLVHSHFGWPKGFGGLLASRSTAIPLVASLHGADILVNRTIRYGRGRDPFFARSIRRLLAEADRTMYYSDFMRREGVGLGAPPERTRVVYWGTDVQAFAGVANRQSLRAELGLPPQPLFLTVAGLIERKGLDKVLHALALLRDRYAFTFVACGEGPELSHLRSLAAALGLDDRVRFAGRVERSLMPKYFAAADVFLHGALIEAAGIVLIEAMASGCPVVCTDAGGPSEYIQDGLTGFVVPVGDAEAMASKTAWLIEHPHQAAQFGATGRVRAVQYFGRQRMLDQVIEVYAELVMQGGRAHEQPVSR